MYGPEHFMPHSNECCQEQTQGDICISLIGDDGEDSPAVDFARVVCITGEPIAALMFDILLVVEADTDTDTDAAAAANFRRLAGAMRRVPRYPQMMASLASILF
mmetsp:Transcript_26124/g.47393  ORF Transcript_26124/g.47393 Transcript_26124/m.47393 type:complete len:104 (-) Transcript_26124:392-703(-)